MIEPGRGPASFGWPRGGSRRYATYVGNGPGARRILPLLLWQAATGHRLLWFTGRFWLLLLAVVALLAVIVGALGGPWWVPLLVLPLAVVVERTSGWTTADGRRSIRQDLLRVLAPARAAAEETARTEAMLAACALRMLELDGWQGQIVRGGWGARGDRVDSARIVHLLGTPDLEAEGDPIGEGVSVEVAELREHDERALDERMRDLAFELGTELPHDERFEVRPEPAELRIDGVAHPSLRLRFDEGEGVRAIVGGAQVTVSSRRPLPHPLVLRTAGPIVDYPEPFEPR